MPLTVNIIGAGKLGKTIGYLFHKNKLLNILGICNTSLESSHKAIDFIHAGIAASSISDLPLADITLITTPDYLIEKTCQELSHSPNLKKNSIVAHCSGALTSDVLISIKLKNCFIASIHPMISFADPLLSIHQYRNIFCAVEGDKQALSILLPLFNSIGSITYEISKDKKVLYHAGSAFACNYLITLTQLALVCFEGAGIDTEKSMNIITSLMKGTVHNLEELKSPHKALTGPIQRGDFKTIKHHMNALKTIGVNDIYAQLAKITLGLTNLNEETKTKIMEILDSLNQDQ